MYKLLITFDEDTAKVLRAQKNKNEYVRESVRYISGHITTDSLTNIRKSYEVLIKQLDELNSKIDYLARRLDEEKKVN